MGDEQRVEALGFAVRPRVILKYLGQLSLVLAALTAVPLIVSLLFSEYGTSLRYAVLVIGLACLGYPLGRLRAPSGMQVNEGLVITALAFVLTPVLVSFPMMASGLSFEDALFEAVSGITTTGLSTLATVQDKPVTFLFSRAWMQWVGGLGIVVLSVALLFGPGVAARRLAFPDEEAEDLAGGTRIHARRVLGIYAMLTLAGFLLLLALGAGAFTSLVHVLAAVSTGGFSSYDRSLAGLGGWAPQAAVILISLTGSVSLALYYFAYKRGLRRLIESPELHTLVAASVAFTCLLFAFMRIWGGYAPADALMHAPLMAFSAQTTAGFASLSVEDLSAASKVLLLFPMLIGGSLGSTAGGIKVFRLLVMLRLMKLLVLRTRLPGHAVVEPRVGAVRLEEEEIQRALLIILMFAIVVLFSWLPFLLLGYDPIDSLFEVVSATGTVGLSSGISSAGLPSLLKGVLCADMLMGRLEVLALLVLLYPGTWFGRKAESS